VAKQQQLAVGVDRGRSVGIAQSIVCRRPQNARIDRDWAGESIVDAGQARFADAHLDEARTAVAAQSRQDAEVWRKVMANAVDRFGPIPERRVAGNLRYSDRAAVDRDVAPEVEQTGPGGNLCAL